MGSTLQQALNTLVGFSTLEAPLNLEACREVFEENRDRIYSLAFWMTDNEITAEEISTRVFCRALSSGNAATAENLDRILINECRELAPIGVLTLEDITPTAGRATGNMKRIHLERAVVQVPATERLAFLMHDVEGYDHSRVSRTLGITEEESKAAVVRARMLIRELVGQMN